MFGSFNTYMYAKRLGDLRTVSGYSVEQLTYLFAKGYTLQPPKEPITMSELAKEMENKNER